MGEKKCIRRKPLKELQLKDDFLFGELMLDRKASKNVLEIVLGRPIGEIVFQGKEETISGGYTKKGIRMDVFMKDKKEGYFDVEMQIRDMQNIPRRMRHYQAVCDVRVLPIGEVGYGKLIPSHIIFICTFDQYGRGRYCYTFENRCIEEPDLAFGDGTKKIILNTKGTNNRETNPELIEFLRLVEDMDSSEPEYERVKYVKEQAMKIKEKEGMEEKYMMAMIHENEIRFDARQEEKRDILMRMLCNGQTPEAISKMTDEPLSFVYEVQKEYLQTVKEGSDWNGEKKETL